MTNSVVNERSTWNEDNKPFLFFFCIKNEGCNPHKEGKSQPALCCIKMKTDLEEAKVKKGREMRKKVQMEDLTKHLHVDFALPSWLSINLLHFMGGFGNEVPFVLMWLKNEIPYISQGLKEGSLTPKKDR
ncbi:hypothetical protein ACJX0J_017706 [Zea mays]